MTTTAPEQRRLLSGIAGLDTILGGGFMLGGLYIVQGAPGAGKTILANQICFHHVAGGGKAMFVTLLAENHARMIANLRQLSFFDETKIGGALTYLSGFTEMQEGGLAELTKLLRREIQRRRISVLVIDGLVTAAASAPNEQTFKVFVHDLQEVALATDCTMFLTTNAGRQISPEQTMVDGLITLSDRVYGWRAESDLQVTKFRGAAYLRGRHAYKIGDAGFVVYPRIEALFAHPSREAAVSGGRVSSGIARLDAMLGGGIPAASTTMVMGSSGIGKTTVGLHFLSRSSSDEPGLMFGFYETPVSLRAKADRIVPALGPLFDSGAVELLWQTPTSDLLDAYGKTLLDAVHRRKVKRLFIDGLTAFRSGAVDPSRVGNFFSALSNELRVRGVTTVYSLEVPNILGPAVNVPVDDASSLAENMILLRFVERGARLYRVVSILKTRDSDFTSSLHEYDLTDKGVEIRDTPDSVEQLLTSKPGGLTMAVVLIVDDEFGIVKLLEEVLTDEGHRVVIATNGQQALERAAREKPGLVVTDFMMPVMDGAALVKAMRADPQLADVPVVIMSSIPEATVAERSPGYAAFVRKPFNIFALVDLVARLAKA